MKNNILLSLIFSLEIHGVIFMLPGEYGRDANGAKNGIRIYLNEAQYKNQYIEATVSVPSDDNSINVKTEKQLTSIPVMEDYSGYLASKYLDVRPRPVNEIGVLAPDIPLGKKEGRIIMELYIDQSGKVRKIVEIYRDVPDEYLVNAMEKFEESEFYPGLKDGNATAAIMKIEVMFFE